MTVDEEEEEGGERDPMEFGDYEGEEAEELVEEPRVIVDPYM